MQTTKSIKVTLTEAELPGGTFATFRHNKQLYICWPQPKHQANLVVTEKLIGALNRVRQECLAWINDWPTDAARVARVLKIIADATTNAQQNTLAKVEAQTQ